MRTFILFFALSVTTANAALELPPTVPDYQLITGVSGGGDWFDGDEYSAERGYHYDSSYYGAGSINAAFYAERFATYGRIKKGRSVDNPIGEIYAAVSAVSGGLKYHSFASLGIGTSSGIITRGDDRRGTKCSSFFADALFGLIYRPDGDFILQVGVGYQGVPAGWYGNYVIWLGESHIKLWDMFGLYFKVGSKHSWDHYPSNPAHNEVDIAVGFDFYTTPDAKETLSK
ncbi:MAG: hypothetical protein GY771_17460 [bacterium]|nr:hypothetical protein [bacterium]